MRDYRSLLYQWIKPLRKIKEFQEIAHTEDLEFLRLYGMTERALLNMFIETADAEGIGRLEKIAGILPDTTDPLETRRARLYLRWGDQKPYTAAELRNRLEAACGEGNVDLFVDCQNFRVEVETRVGGYGIFDEVLDVLEYFLPANLEIDLSNRIDEESSTSVFLGVGISTAVSYEITNDIDMMCSPASVSYEGGAALSAIEHMITNDIEDKIEEHEQKGVAGVASVSMLLNM